MENELNEIDYRGPEVKALEDVADKIDGVGNGILSEIDEKIERMKRTIEGGVFIISILLILILLRLK